MTREKKEADVIPAARPEFCPPTVAPVQNCDFNFPLAPEMAELRYQLMVRRGMAWGNGKKLNHAF